ncbi:hypothetical protein [Clostridium tyrobutyricum]|uniref:hypothetical protein n=1 Tax=Clostridium tyrobutyricum TaxID=1519 RepID=UPI001C38EF48|nr:hypothetical protein [Clostridium tyrobutyricum]MBV4426173.1 hypothetical protein [Clostridium tyrobutyricum]
MNTNINTATKPYKLHDMKGKPLSQADTDYIYGEKLKGCIERLVLSEDEAPYALRQLYYCTSNGLRFEVVSAREV